MPLPEPVKVFIVYSPKDEEFREQLQEYLYDAKRQGLIENWHDRKIAPAQEGDKAIDENLQAADIILLLISPDFMASDFAYEEEMLRAVERHDRSEASVVIPIIVRRADWQWASFGRFQALPRDAKPIAHWSDRDEAWMDVVRGIRAAVKQLRR